ncbi:MAG: glucosamine--fructose-6-phosphate aminotransferase [Gammaproteobacteria bacterium]|nr:glucosamine--fructose-6-phosphate aminotransferase [Gammaproteobacteria bacterium]
MSEDPVIMPGRQKEAAPAMESIRLGHCLEAEDSERFKQRLASALNALPRGSLPLHAGCGQGGLVDDSDISASVLGVEQDNDRFVARVGIFFTEIVGGCNCNDDPLEVNAYCVLEVAISRADGVATFTPLQS